MFSRRSEQPDPLRTALEALALRGELARVVLPSGITFVGVPTVGKGSVMLSTREGRFVAVVRLGRVAAVHRVSTVTPTDRPAPRRRRVVA